MNQHILWLGVAAIIAVSLGHYVTPTTAPQIHDALRRLYYFPIVLVAIRCGARSGLVVAFLAVVTYVPHLWTHWGGAPLGAQNFNRTFEMIMWVAVAGLAGVLSARERLARQIAESTRQRAEEARDAAEESARSLLDAEDRLRSADRMATLGFLTASLAHEVRNPLGSLRGIADTLYREFPAGHSRRELVDILDEEVRRLDGVVTHYLEHARSSPEPGPAEVREAVAAVCRLLNTELTNRRIATEVDVAPDGLTVAMPTDFLRQALLNLLLNSLAAIGDCSGRIRIHAREEEDGVTLVVDDDGPGFSDDVLGGNRSKFGETQRHGTGFGLPIVEQLVDSYGGRLTLANRSGGGARVTITIGGGSE